MTRTSYVLFSAMTLTGIAFAAPKPHVITFGKWTAVKWLAGADEATPLEIRIRALYVDGKLRNSRSAARMK